MIILYHATVLVMQIVLVVHFNNIGKFLSGAQIECDY